MILYTINNIYYNTIIQYYKQYTLFKYSHNASKPACNSHFSSHGTGAMRSGGGLATPLAVYMCSQPEMALAGGRLQHTARDIIEIRKVHAKCLC